MGQDNELTRAESPGAEQRRSERPKGQSLISELREASIDRYAFEGELAAGGMGLVELVSDKALVRTVARKKLLPQFEASSAHTEMLVREARITARLDHPNIVPVHDLGVCDDGEIYFTMKVVAGQTLSAWIKRENAWARPRSNELLDQLDAVIKVCDSLSFAHDRGVLHRDIKPSNVMVGEHGEVYLMDWGVACLLEEEVDRAINHDPKEEPALIGTFNYMPPEQARGAPLDKRADIFAMGALLFHVIYGRPPHQGKSRIQILAAALLSEPEPPPELRDSTPKALSRIVMKAMSKDPDQRYQSTIELKAALVGYVRGEEAFALTTFAANETIISEGDEGDTAYIIESGRCLVSIGGQDIREMGPGEVFGEMAIVRSSKRTATVRALEETIARTIVGATLREELDALKPWMGALVRTLVERVAERQ